MIDVALLTEKRYLKSKSKSWYIQNILAEDSLIQHELEKLDITSKRVAWDDKFVPSEFKFALFRTTWNYFDEINKFLLFLDTCKGQVGLINPYSQIIWNLDKRYLLEMENKGVNIVKTYIAKKNQSETLREISNNCGWSDIIIKPCISAAAWNTHYIQNKNIENYHSVFQKLIAHHDMMIQPFQKNVVLMGEVSFMIVNGGCTHAVLKKAKKGDFRVQDDFGGSVEPYQPSKEEVCFVESIITRLPFRCLYARVDVILDNDNNLALSELELIEPEMWFRFNSSAAKKLASGIQSYLSGL